MNEEKPYVELLKTSGNPHTSFLEISETILAQNNLPENTKQTALKRVVDAYEEVCGRREAKCNK
ncbi:hypothetical protein [Alteribacillus sp. HJP-4]|uniref:hypothetical protein n=1 Tax=Alteribacillus sp. HJP-4 TaxID=2775394 RepID=UPI0035CD33A1